MALDRGGPKLPMLASMKQAEDFRAECASIEALLRGIEPGDFARPTAFKDWTFDRILHHLHMFNDAALLSLSGEEGLAGFKRDMGAKLSSMPMAQVEAEYCGGLTGPALLDLWAEFYPKLADAFADMDPKARLPWFGPSMSARSSITARLMETWSHAQAIYDELGAARQSTDGIENIAVLGLNTYGWTFVNRKMDVPEPRPQLVLTAPSGAIWTLGEEAEGELVKGSAEEFCQVVTQTRNIADTSLEVTGPNANAWMGFAQCFAGPPNDPPTPGSRAMKHA
ncbi:MAG: TIGR03084 family metal-binding protein [Marinomonas sp.]